MDKPREKARRPFVSIVITFYDAEDTVDYCLSSVLNQSYEPYEVICIDDGSRDRTLDKIKKYAANGRVEFFTKENGGPAAARNFGAEKASGEYISFIDGDDCISPYYLEALVNAMIELPCDFVVGKMRVMNFSDIGNCEWRKPASGENTLIDQREYLERLLYDEIPLSTCARLAPRKLYVDNPAKIGVGYEDVDMAARYVKHLDAIGVVDCDVYGYVMREDSVVHRKKAQYKQVLDYLTAMGDFSGDVEEFFPKTSSQQVFFHALHYSRIYRLLCVVGDAGHLVSEEKQKIRSYLKRSNNLIRKDARVSRGNIIRFCLLAYAPMVYNCLFTMYERIKKGV